MRQKVRRILAFSMLLLFPIVLNYLSPYVSLNAAFEGIVAGSVLLFLLLFLSGIFLGRAWCAWVCPVAGLSEMGAAINNKPVNRRKLAVLRYAIFGAWFAVLITGFVLAGGIKGVNPLYMTENVISVDAPSRYIVYYFVLALLFVLTVTVGRRGACHAVCWMAPFLTAGEAVGRALRLPQLRIRSNPEACIDCRKCTQKCPMSIDVNKEIKTGTVRTFDCIRCGECADACPKKVLSYGMKIPRVPAKPREEEGRRPPLRK